MITPFSLSSSTILSLELTGLKSLHVDLTCLDVAWVRADTFHKRHLIDVARTAHLLLLLHLLRLLLLGLSLA